MFWNGITYTNSNRLFSFIITHLEQNYSNYFEGTQYVRKFTCFFQKVFGARDFLSQNNNEALSCFCNYIKRQTYNGPMTFLSLYEKTSRAFENF